MNPHRSHHHAEDPGVVPTRGFSRPLVNTSFLQNQWEEYEIARNPV